MAQQGSDAPEKEESLVSCNVTSRSVANPIHKRVLTSSPSEEASFLSAISFRKPGPG